MLQQMLAFTPECDAKGFKSATQSLSCE